MDHLVHLVLQNLLRRNNGKAKVCPFVPRDKPPKLGPGRHKKNLNKSEKE